jgi:hypothetical protein
VNTYSTWLRREQKQSGPPCTVKTTLLAWSFLGNRTTYRRSRLSGLGIHAHDVSRERPADRASDILESKPINVGRTSGRRRVLPATNFSQRSAHIGLGTCGAYGNLLDSNERSRVALLCSGAEIKDRGEAGTIDRRVIDKVVVSQSDRARFEDGF